MVYTRNQPVATDDLDISQPFLVSNTNSADDSFGVDHYQFSDLTVNNGFHKKVTTPSGAAIATAANPVLFAQGAGNAGPLQFSRGPNNAIASPLTTLQAIAGGETFANGNTLTILNFSGLPVTLAMIYHGSNTLISGVLRGGFAYVIYNGASMSVQNFGSGGGVAQVSGTTLQLFNNTGSDLSKYFWTLQFFRIAT